VGVGVVCWTAVACGAVDVCAVDVFDDEPLPALFALSWEPSVSFGDSGAPVASNWSIVRSSVLRSPLPPLVVVLALVEVEVVELLDPELLELLVPPLEPEEPMLPEPDVEGAGAFQVGGGAGVPPPMLRGAQAGEPTTDPVKMRFTQFLSEKM
jgi:hypothetical protein